MGTVGSRPQASAPWSTGFSWVMVGDCPPPSRLAKRCCSSTATTMMMPLATNCTDVDRLFWVKTLVSVEKISTPRRCRRSCRVRPRGRCRRRPPRRWHPARRACRGSRCRPWCAPSSIDRRRCRPRRPPACTGTTVWRFTLTPARRDASALPPIATVRRPNVVRLQEEPAGDRDDREDPDQPGDAEQVTAEEVRKPCTVAIWVLLVGDQLRQAARSDQHRQSRHERHDPPVGDDDPVHEAGEHADGDRDHHHERPEARSAAACTPASVATTDARPMTDPTERSIPPAVMTKVMPMLTTPMIEAKRKIVRRFSKFENRSPAVIAPASDHQQQGDHEAEVAPPALPSRRRSGLTEVSREPRGGRNPDVGGGGLAHAAIPSMTRSSTRCSSMSVAVVVSKHAALSDDEHADRRGRVPPRSRWRPRRWRCRHAARRRMSW